MSRKTKSKKTKERKRLHKINESERKRLGASSVVNARCFKQRQKFGAASGVTQINQMTYDALSKTVNESYAKTNDVLAP